MSKSTKLKKKRQKTVVTIVVVILAIFLVDAFFGLLFIPRFVGIPDNNYAKFVWIYAMILLVTGAVVLVTVLIAVR